MVFTKAEEPGLKQARGHGSWASPLSVFSPQSLAGDHITPWHQWALAPYMAFSGIVKVGAMIYPSGIEKTKQPLTVFSLVLGKREQTLLEVFLVCTLWSF